jgi:Rps23 Pro-64 3,4-dihydroxylase Tpa1-like proline 4-hydroxylase
MDDLIKYEEWLTKEENSILQPKLINWNYGSGSVPKSDVRNIHVTPFWYIDFSNDPFFADHLLNKVRQTVGDNSLKLERVYANGATYGQPGSFHQDCYDDTGRTFLYYANTSWSEDWGGSTQFNIGDGMTTNVFPKSNRAVYFPGMRFHSSTALNRSYKGLRVTIAWKLIK